MRKVEKFPIDEFAREIGWQDPIDVEVFVDYENKAEIIKTIEARKKKFRRILYLILAHRYDSDLYDKEVVSEKSKQVTAMKFKKGKNQRIYCKEYRNTDGKRIVMICSVNKKSQKNDKKLRNLIETIGGYDYGF